MNAVLIILLIFVCVCVASWIMDTHRFVTRSYEIVSDKARKDTTLVLLSDLHNKEYGEGNNRLIAAIDEIAPDAVLIAGDMPDALKGHDFTPAVRLIGELAGRYPIYYGFGNHEYRLRIYPDVYGSMYDEYVSALDESGVRIMDNEHAYIDEANIEIDALTMERRFYKRFGGVKLTKEDVTGYLGEIRSVAEVRDGASDHFHILIAHDPEYFEAYSDWGADLTVSGHVHGGVMRLPLIGGVISPRFTLFPKYSGGEYERNGRRMIVSCGLGTHSIHIRVFNPAELSVIHIRRPN